MYKINRTTLRYRRHYSVMSRVAASYPGDRVQDPARAYFSFIIVYFIMSPFLWVYYRNVGSTPSIYCIVTDKVCMAEASGPGILKVTFLCLNSA